MLWSCSYSTYPVRYSKLVYRISSQAFAGCRGLTKVEIPAAIKQILDGAFAFSGLKKVTFESGSQLETIGERVSYFRPFSPFSSSSVALVFYTSCSIVFNSLLFA